MEPGQKLLHYTLVEKVGEGGMGVVWKAQDTNLDRDVAIKILPAAFAHETERLARFEREAKLLASLNHSSIATVYGMHPAAGPDDPSFIAMEYIPGEDLEERLARGPLPVDDALQVAQRIAEALEAAHESGIIHRDLKPANVKLTADDQVKVLDFGLAKALGGDPSSGAGASVSPSMSPTMTSAGTLVGMILGTAAYMSPEQAKGKPVDRRADIWAFGVVLAEMLSGKRMFRAETVSETLAQVLMTDVDLDALPEATPNSVRRLIERCLERDPARRLRDIGEARIILDDVNSGRPRPEDEAAVGEDLATEHADRAPAARRTRLGALLPWAIAVGAVAVAAALWQKSGSGRDEPQKRLATSITAPADVAFDLGSGMALSPDGSRLVFVGSSPGTPARLWIRELDNPTARPLEGTEDGTAPFWSPDGTRLGFLVGDTLKKMDVQSGLIATVGSSPAGYGATWSINDDIVISGEWGRPLERIPAAGGRSEAVPTPELSLGDKTAWPYFLPDGNHFVYLVRTYGSADLVGEIRLGSLDGTTNRLLVHANSNPIFVRPETLLWWNEGNLYAQQLDLQRLELVGEPRGLVAGVRFDPGWGRMMVTASDNGMLLFQDGLADEGNELQLVNRQGERLRTVGNPGSYYGPRLSRDGRRIVVDISGDSNRGDIWTLDVETGSETRLTMFSGDDTRPRWAPNGREVAYTSTSLEGATGVWITSSLSSSEPRLLAEATDADLPVMDWTSSGYLLVGRDELSGIDDIHAIDVKDGKVTPWATTEFIERAATASPDGRFAAYNTDETGRNEIWVQTFPEPGRRWRVSQGGGNWPCWRQDGGELYYVDSHYRMVAVSVNWVGSGEDRSPEFGDPEVLFSTTVKEHTDRQYDTLDGKTFLINHSDMRNRRPLTLLQGWLP